jgi:hypothetical protein
MSAVEREVVLLYPHVRFGFLKINCIPPDAPQRRVASCPSAGSLIDVEFAAAKKVLE